MKQNRASVGYDYGLGVLGLWLRRHDLQTEEREILTEEGWKAAPPAGTSTPPTLHLDDNVAQELMDHLWANGIRPAMGDTHYTAIEAHLEDMRHIVFAQLKISKPGVSFTVEQR